MARPYSQDLRDRVIEATGNGTSARQAAVRFDVGVSTAIKWVERLRDSGERSARRQGRRPGSKLDAHRDFLLAVIEAAQDVFSPGIWWSGFSLNLSGSSVHCLQMNS